MTSLQIRELPPEIAEALRLRARRANRSLSQQALVELKRLPELESRERRLEILKRIREDSTAPVLPIPPEDLVREDRDR